MGGSVGSIAEVGVAPGADFDAIVGSGAGHPVSASTSATAAQRPVARVPRRGGRGRALVAISALVVAGVTLGASVIVSVELSKNPVTQQGSVLTGEKLAAAAKSTAVAAGPGFGSTVALGTDLAVSVSDPIAYSPTSKAVGAGAGVDVVSTVTVTNVGPDAVDSRLDFAVLGTSSARISDAAGGIRLVGPPSLAPGKSATFRVAFAVADVEKMSVKVTGDSGDSVTFVG